MTISETLKKWGISPKTLLRYLDNGIIANVSVTDNIVNIPDIPKPLIPAYNAKITKEKVVRYILKALNSFMYIDYKILFIEAEQFSAIMKQMEKNGYIEKTSDNADYLSTIGFISTENGDKINANKFKLDSLNFSFEFVYSKFFGKIEVKLSREE